MKNSRLCKHILVITVIIYQILLLDGASYIPSYRKYYSAPLSLQNQNGESALLQVLMQLRQAMLSADDVENSKRGLDLGLGRGFSGSQAAKHLMGLAAANFAGGPGRRRRNE